MIQSPNTGRPVGTANQPCGVSSRKHPWTREIICILISGILLAALTATPVLAGTKYLSGSPEIAVSICGTNEFAPGATVPLTLQVQNTGLNNIKIVQSSVVERDDIPSTAKMVTVALKSGESPILVKTDPQMIGDILASQSVPVTFDIRVPNDAKAGTYTLPVEIDYTYLADAEQEGTDSIIYRYNSKKQTIDLPFIVKSAINLEITDIDAENINAGGSGFLTLTLENTGSDTGKNAIANLSRNGNSPIIPVSSSVYLGTFAPGEKKVAKFKVSVNKDAEPQEYPINLVITYENADGETLSTPMEKVGVTVGAKIKFTVTSEPPTISPGHKSFIEVTYRNDGSATAHGAEVRLSAVDPFSSNDDLSYLGDIPPGESAIARFGLNVESGADLKTYGLDSEVKYRDALDDTQVSDTIKVPIEVVKAEGLLSILLHPVVLAFLIILLLGGAYFYYENRRKQSSR